jgi:hypothetical protein
MDSVVHRFLSLFLVYSFWFLSSPVVFYLSRFNLSYLHCFFASFCRLYYPDVFFSFMASDVFFIHLLFIISVCCCLYPALAASSIHTPILFCVSYVKESPFLPFYTPFCCCSRIFVFIKYISSRC